MTAVRILCCLSFAALLGACARTHDDPAAPTLLAADPGSGIVAVYSVGARNVRVLYVRPPSIVLLREVFVPEGERITDVRFSAAGDALVVDTEVTRFALDTHTWRLARIPAQARGVAAAGRARRPG